MTLSELITKVKEKNLSKEELEDYHSQLSSLFAQMMMEMADLEKEEALYMGKKWEASVAQVKIWWKATESGLRLIMLKRYSLATKELINSLKSRIYTFL